MPIFDVQTIEAILALGTVYNAQEIADRLNAITLTGVRNAPSSEPVWGEHMLAVLEVVQTVDRPTIPLSQLVAKIIAVTPRGDSARDTRRQTAARAVRALAKRKDGPVGMLGETVIIYK